MSQRTLPYTLEDRTGQPYATDFDDIYDRLFLRVVEQSSRPPLVSVQSYPPSAISNTLLSTSPARVTSMPAPQRTVSIYDMAHRWSPRRANMHLERAPAASIRFGPDDELGNVEFHLAQLDGSMPVNKWMPRTGYFASQLSRQFTASNGRRYQWTFRTIFGHDWACSDADSGVVAASYDSRPVKGASNQSINALTILEQHAGISVEILCSLIIMRHLQFHHP